MASAIRAWADRRLQVNLLRALHAGGNALLLLEVNGGLMIDHVEVAVAWAVEVLRSLIEDLVRVERVEVLHSVCLRMKLLVAELKVLVEAAACRAGARISWRLALSLDALNDLARFRIDATERVYRAVLAVRVHDSVASLRDVSSATHCERLTTRHLLTSRRMVHKLRLVHVRRNARHIRSLNHDSLMTTNVSRVLLTLATLVDLELCRRVKRSLLRSSFTTLGRLDSLLGRDD